MIAEHKKRLTKSLQKTGTNKEITEHMLIMDELVKLAEVVSKDLDAWKKAKDKVLEKRKFREQIRDSAMAGMVKRIDLCVEASSTPEAAFELEDDAREAPRRSKRRKSGYDSEAIDSAINAMKESMEEQNIQYVNDMEKQARRHAEVLEGFQSIAKTMEK